MEEMQIYEKQQIIDNLINEFIKFKPYEKENGIDRSTEEVSLVGKEIALKVCDAIYKVMLGNYFLPRYYKLSNYLFEEYNRLDNKEEAFGVCSRLRNVHNKTTEFLSSILQLSSQDQILEPL